MPSPSPPSARPSRFSTPQILLGVFLVVAGAWAFATLPSQLSPAKRHIDAGIEYVRQRKAREAEREWREAVKLDPQNALAWDLLGDLYLSGEMGEQALEALQQVAKWKPDAERLQERLARAAHLVGDKKAAYAYAQEALKRNPDSIPALALSAELLTDGGEDQLRLDYLRRLVRLNPNEPTYWNQLAKALTSRHLYAEAREAIEKLLALNPKDFEAYSMRGRGWFDSDRSPEGLAKAEADLRKALEIEPRAPFPYLYLGRIYRLRGENAQALSALEAAAKRGPNRPDVFLELSKAYQQAGKSQEADQARQRFQTLREETDLAGTLEKRCLAFPNDFDLHRRTGLFMLKLNDLPRAEYYLHKAQVLRPDSKDIQAALEQLAARQRLPSEGGR